MGCCEHRLWSNLEFFFFLFGMLRYPVLSLEGHLYVPFQVLMNTYIGPLEMTAMVKELI